MHSERMIAASYSDESKGTFIVELAGDIPENGIYFLPVRTLLPKILLDMGIRDVGLDEKSVHHSPLKNFIKLTVSSGSGTSHFLEYGRMGNAPKFTLKKPMDLNSVTEEELMLVPGIGKKTAENILAYRQENKRFEKIEDLVLVKGIKNKKFFHLRKYLSVE